MLNDVSSGGSLRQGIITRVEELLQDISDLQLTVSMQPAQKKTLQGRFSAKKRSILIKSTQKPHIDKKQDKTIVSQGLYQTNNKDETAPKLSPKWISRVPVLPYQLLKIKHLPDKISLL
jgi:hypothetical protein